MKLSIFSSIFLLALTSTTFAGHILKEPVPVPIPFASPTTFYVGIFGGGGSSNNISASQYGTAFFPEISGGPLAVNAFGRLNNESASFFGLQLGYQTQEIFINSSSQWALVPAAELEGYSMSNSTFNGTLINNTARLPEHDFQVSYPMSRNVFLVSAVLGFNNPRLIVHPYIGFGIGDAIVRISGASAMQTNPPEADVNHYNTNTSDTTSAFAGQIKLGLSYDITDSVSLFADYRWMYLAGTHFIFGSTVSPAHVETSSWQVNLKAQRYNLGNLGVRFNF